MTSPPKPTDAAPTPFRSAQQRTLYTTLITPITRLGLRGVDVKRLPFSDLDWPGNQLSVVQAKIGHRVQLPLLKDVGWAVTDYIRSGRPRCEHPEVFVRHTAPIGPFSGQGHLSYGDDAPTPLMC